MKCIARVSLPGRQRRCGYRTGQHEIAVSFISAVRGLIFDVVIAHVVGSVLHGGQRIGRPGAVHGFRRGIGGVIGIVAGFEVGHLRGKQRSPRVGTETFERLSVQRFVASRRPPVDPDRIQFRPVYFIEIVAADDRFRMTFLFRGCERGRFLSGANEDFGFARFFVGRTVVFGAPRGKECYERQNNKRQRFLSGSFFHHLVSRRKANPAFAVFPRFCRYGLRAFVCMNV